MPKKKLSIKEFTLQAIKNLRNPNYNTKGIHVRFSGFNEAFRKYFPEKDPIKELAKLVEEKVIELQARKGGPMMYKFGDAPSNTSGEDALQRILKNK